jgi:hypothetical protein
MKPVDSHTLMLALRVWLDGGDTERKATRIAAYVIAQSLAGHFGYFKLLLDMVDGRIHQSAVDTQVFEPDCVPSCRHYDIRMSADGLKVA